MCYPGTSVVFNGSNVLLDNEDTKTWTDGCGGGEPITACKSECIPESIREYTGYVTKNYYTDDSVG
jgi:hypothetical protein